MRCRGCGRWTGFFGKKLCVDCNNTLGTVAAVIAGAAMTAQRLQSKDEKPASVSPLPTDQDKLQQLVRDAIYPAGAVRIESEEHRVLDVEQYLCLGVYVTFDDAHVTLRFKDDSIIAYSWTVAGLYNLMAKLREQYDVYAEELAAEGQLCIDEHLADGDLITGDDLFADDNPVFDEDFAVDKPRKPTSDKEALDTLANAHIIPHKGVIKTMYPLSRYTSDIQMAVNYLVAEWDYAWEQAK